MAIDTAVNAQITDSVTQANTKVVGDAPAPAMGALYQATAQALANAAHDATNAQRQGYATQQAATTMGVTTLYSIDAAGTGAAKGIQAGSPAGRALEPDAGAKAPADKVLGLSVRRPDCPSRGGGRPAPGPSENRGVPFRAPMKACCAL